MLGELVSFKNTNGLILDGMLFQVDNPIATIIHVHGSFGNFYQNQFIKVMAELYTQANINFLTFNLTTHDGISEGITHVNGIQQWNYTGYSLSDFNTCISDIRGAIKYAENFNARIILQGHSLGCDRILFFLTKCSCQYDCILLSPNNQRVSQEAWIYPEKVDKQIHRLESTNEDSFLLPLKEYGVISQDGMIEDAIDSFPFIPISKHALLSILKSPAFTFWDDLKNSSIFINCNVYAYIGGLDEYNSEGNGILKDLQNHVKNFTICYLADSNHHFLGHEQTVCSSIIKWIKEIKL